MSNPLNDLKQAINAARRDKNYPNLARLQTLMGEAQAVAKNEQRDVTDEDVSRTAEKFIKGVQKNIELSKGTETTYKLIIEVRQYEEYVLSDPFDNLTVAETIALLTEQGQPVNVGSVMKAGKGRFNVQDVKAAL